MSTKAEVFSILERNVPNYFLKDYINGILNEEENMFYAFSVTDVNPERHNDYPHIS
ncbi:hypothetical protein [Niabella hibiscisoli]|uniref:hypothetical protein n=1 Tax=Niabella hibiscisoli TaxID=1825928 RepID=UPI001F0E301A|nr:hypothetical protein [Niabella hibiscisoli]MCH5715364.1 hypothetical protein [Niabella hibiscisoli]